MRFLGVAGCCGRFCESFSGIAGPLTGLLEGGTGFEWNDGCQDAFDRLGAILESAPVLLAPGFDRCFGLAVDAGGVGVGAVLLQEDSGGVGRPVCYFSKKFGRHRRNYSAMGGVSCFGSGGPAVRGLFGLFGFAGCCVRWSWPFGFSTQTWEWESGIVEVGFVASGVWS